MIRLRRVRDEDAGTLADLWRDEAARHADVASDQFRVPDREGLGAWLVAQLSEDADPKRRLVLVADVDGEAVGFVVAAVVAPHADAVRQMHRTMVDRQVRIEALVAAADAPGVDERLIRAAEDWAGNRGARTVTAQAPVPGPSRDRYEQRGWDAHAVMLSRTLPDRTDRTG